MSPETRACFAAHKQLGDQIATIVRRLGSQCESEADLLRLGASYVKFATHRALAARDEKEAVRRWIETELGERQVRSATYQALRKREITNFEYDRIFSLAAAAYRMRQREIERLRHRLRAAAFT